MYLCSSSHQEVAKEKRVAMIDDLKNNTSS